MNNYKRKSNTATVKLGEEESGNSTERLNKGNTSFLSSIHEIPPTAERWSTFGR